MRFVNFSNHPVAMWSDKQREAAEQYGEILDMPFPSVDANSSKAEVDELAEEYVARILEYEPAAVMCQGEFTLCYAVVTRLKERGIMVVAACSERNVEITDDGKIVRFEFVKFREY